MNFSAGTTAAAALCFVALLFVSSGLTQVTALGGIEVEHDYFLLNVTPTVIVGSVSSNDIVRCARVPVSGISRLKLGSYSSARRITFVPYKSIPEKSFGKIKICLHRNSSLGFCLCEGNNWESIRDGTWSAVISPYQDRYIDVKFSDNLSGSVTISSNIEFHKWRLIFLGVGLVFFILAPIVSCWVPFYYSSSMAIGVCLVIIILLFQGMKLLPTGRKNALYSTICGIALGAGSFLINRLSMFVNSVLANFGFSEELHNPVLIFLGVGIILTGAGFGYWLVRKFVVSDDGSVDVDVALFVKWALRIIAGIFVSQSTLDIPLALGLLVSFLAIYVSIISMKWDALSSNESPQKWRSERVSKKYKRAEFLPANRNLKERTWKSLKSVSGHSPARGVVSSSNRRYSRHSPTYYSTYHKTPDRKKFSEEEWKEFTEASTRQAVAELASSPEFTDWIMNNADRIRFREGDSTEESVGSGSDSTNENIALSSSRRGFFQ